MCMIVLCCANQQLISGSDTNETDNFNGGEIGMFHAASGVIHYGLPKSWVYPQSKNPLVNAFSLTNHIGLPPMYGNFHLDAWWFNQSVWFALEQKNDRILNYYTFWVNYNDLNQQPRHRWWWMWGKSSSLMALIQVSEL